MLWFLAVVEKVWEMVTDRALATEATLKAGAAVVSRIWGSVAQTEAVKKKRIVESLMLSLSITTKVTVKIVMKSEGGTSQVYQMLDPSETVDRIFQS